MEERRAESSPVELPWWLAGGELCGFCLQEYALEMEYRCIDCDRPVCPLCVVVIREVIRCVECDAAATGGSDAGDA